VGAGPWLGSLAQPDLGGESSLVPLLDGHAEVQGPVEVGASESSRAHRGPLAPCEQVELLARRG